MERCKRDVVVVGAGHNSLVAACYLARAGLDVEVVEAYDRPGGMTATNPIIAGAPDHLINEGSIDSTLFRISGIDRELGLHRLGLRQRALDPMHAYLDVEGESLCIWRDPRRTADEIRRFSRRDATAWLELARTLDAALDFVVPFMLTNPMRPAPGALLSALKGMRRYRELAPLIRMMTASQAEVICERFEHPMVRAPLAGLPIFAPMDGDDTGWIVIYLGVLHRYGLGRFIGGTGELPRALIAYLESKGGRVRTSAAVDALTVESGRVTGVHLRSGEELAARAVVAGCNPRTTLTQLLPAGVLSDEWTARAEHIPTSRNPVSFFKLDLALKGRLDLPRHHAKRGDGVDLRAPISTMHSFEHYVESWRKAQLGELPDPIPTLVTVPTAADPSQAPAGQDTFWFYSGLVPIRPNEPWETLGPKAADIVLRDCVGYFEGIEDLEIGRSVRTPLDLAERFAALDGNIFHVDGVIHRHGPLRPGWGFGGYKTPVPGLFLTGAGTHPSAGISGTAGRLAAAVAARSLRGERDDGRRPRTQQLRPPAPARPAATEPVASPQGRR